MTVSLGEKGSSLNYVCVFCDGSNNSTVNISTAQAAADIGKGLRREEPSMA